MKRKEYYIFSDSSHLLSPTLSTIQSFLTPSFLCILCLQPDLLWLTNGDKQMEVGYEMFLVVMGTFTNLGRDLYAFLLTEILLMVIPSLNCKVKEDENFKIGKYNMNMENS